MTPPILEIHDLTAAYQRRPILWNVDWTVASPSLTAVIGPNGAGKSTLIRAALGLTPAVSGEVRAFGEPVSAVRKRIG